MYKSPLGAYFNGRYSRLITLVSYWKLFIPPFTLGALVLTGSPQTTLADNSFRAIIDFCALVLWLR